MLIYLIWVVIVRMFTDRENCEGGGLYIQVEYRESQPPTESNGTKFEKMDGA